MPRILNNPAFWFWIYQGSIYNRVLNMLLVLIMSGFWIYHGSKYAWVIQSSEYAWMIPGYAKLCLNVPKSDWVAFLFYAGYFYKISNLLLPLGAEGARGRESWYTQPMIYPINISMMLFKCFIYLLCCCFSTFWCFKGPHQRFTKAVIL